MYQSSIDKIDQEFNEKLTRLFYSKQQNCFEQSQDDYQRFKNCFKPFYDKLDYLQQQLQEYPFYSQMKYNTCLSKNNHDQFCQDQTAETNKKLFDNLYQSLLDNSK